MRRGVPISRGVSGPRRLRVREASGFILIDTLAALTILAIILTPHRPPHRERRL